MKDQLATPLVLIIFNRPDLTSRVFEKMKEVRPERLFIIADGPRMGNDSDIGLCRDTREVVENIDWDCEVSRDYSDVNLGSGKRISSGLDRVFDQVREAIILEDDCLPDPSFFTFCTKLLDYYRDNERVINISGFSPPVNSLKNHHPSYYYSVFTGTSGWATWARVWKRVDSEIKEWNDLRKENWLLDKLGDVDMANYFKDHFNDVQNGVVDAWDIQLNFLLLKEGLFTIKSKRNLVHNIGFGRADASNTVFDNKLGKIETEIAEDNISHPDKVEWNRKIDQEVFNNYHKIPRHLVLIKRVMKKNPSFYKFIKRAVSLFKL